MAFMIFLALSFLIHGALGELVCEELSAGMCSFAISSSGNRCLLETSSSRKEVSKGLVCKTSQIFANGFSEYIETDSCVRACGVDRKAVGISTDSLHEPRFITSLCSSNCLNNCPNLVDFYHNLALEEGAYLPDVCSKVQAAVELRQNIAHGPASSPIPLPVPDASEVTTDSASAPSRILSLHL